MANSFSRVRSLTDLGAAMFALNIASQTATAALPVLKRGQRVEDWMDGPCTVTRRVGNDYYVKFDDGSKSLIGRGDLTPIG